MTQSEYQYDYTKNPVAAINMYDHAGRLEKAQTILAVLEDYLSTLDGLTLLEMSSSAGLMTQAFGKRLKKVVGIDIDENAVSFAVENNPDDHIEFHLMDAQQTEFGDNSFDVVVCNQMYEHVPDPNLLMKEIYRVLKPNGVCYFGATNRLKIVETHYGRNPFLSYLPKSMANIYLHVLGRGNYYYENLYGYWKLRKLTETFKLIDYTRKVVAEPGRYHATEMVKNGSFQQRLALMVLRYAYWFFPGYIWLLKKQSSLNERRRND